MRTLLVITLAAFVSLAAVQDQKWHRTLKDGKKAAAVSGKPIFLLTIWSKGT